MTCEPLSPLPSHLTVIAPTVFLFSYRNSYKSSPAEAFLYKSSEPNTFFYNPSRSTTLFYRYRTLFSVSHSFDMGEEIENLCFEMGSLRTNLPQKRGLSRYYSGKARSFTSIADVHCLEDLKKNEHPAAKKRKKHSEGQDIHPAPCLCGRVSGGTQCATPCLGV